MLWVETTVPIMDLPRCGRAGNITATPFIFFTENSDGLRRKCTHRIIANLSNFFIDTMNFRKSDMTDGNRTIYQREFRKKRYEIYKYMRAFAEAWPDQDNCARGHCTNSMWIRKKKNSVMSVY